MTKLKSLILFVLFCSCKHVQEKQVENETPHVKQDFYSLDIRSAIDTQKEAKLSSLASELHYVPLETNPACLIAKVKQIRIIRNYIFVLDKKALYKFDLNGKFIQQIGAFGKGPGEYGMVFRYATVEALNELILYCYPGGANNVYDIETGMYKRRFRTGLDTYGMTEFPNGKITYLTTNSPFYSDIPASKQPKINNELVVCSPEGEYLDSIPDSRPAKKGNMGSWSIHYKANSSLYYMDSFQDTLSVLSEAFQKKPYLSFGLNNSLKGYEVKLERLIGEVQFPDLLIANKVLETSTHFFIEIQHGIGLYVEPEISNFIYNKSTHQLINCTTITNDIDGGLPLWPKYNYNDSILVASQNAYEVIDQLKSSTSGKVNSTLSDLDANDNPVLVFAKLK